MENSTINEFLNMTAWRMDAPQLFGGFHIIVSLLTASLAVLAAVIFARRVKAGQNVLWILAVMGWILVVLEVYKQLFLYYVVNGGAFDWWFFPFQLCSVPMYLCVLLPFISKNIRSTFMTFMGGYTFISAAATLIYPEDILRPYIALTAHGFIWHGLLLFISLLIVFTGCMDISLHGIRKAAILFVILCAVAIIINIAAESAMPAIRAAHPAVAHNWAAMFYLNPFHISPQPIVNTVQKAAGIPVGLVLYILAVVAAGSISDILLSRIFRAGRQSA